MRYLIQDPESGQFWAGNRWSHHIGEAVRYTERKAFVLRRELADQHNLSLVLLEAPR